MWLASNCQAAASDWLFAFPSLFHYFCIQNLCCCYVIKESPGGQCSVYMSCTVINGDHSFPWAAEFWPELQNLLFCCRNEPSSGIYAFPWNLSNFWKYTPKRMLFFSSLVPATHQKSNQYFISQVFIHASWPLSMSSLVMYNILSVSYTHLTLPTIYSV